MSVAEYLGWARSLLDSLGITNAVIAIIVISIAAVMLRRFFDR